MLLLDRSNTAVIHNSLRCGFLWKRLLVRLCRDRPRKSSSDTTRKLIYISIGFPSVLRDLHSTKDEVHCQENLLKGGEKEGGTTFSTYHSEMWIQLWLDVRSAWRGFLDRKQVRNTKVFSNVTGFWKIKRGGESICKSISQRISTWHNSLFICDRRKISALVAQWSLCQLKHC